MDLFGGGDGTGPVDPSQRFGGQPWTSCFFAVLPPPDVARAVDALGHQLRRSMGLRGKLIGPDRYHITLCGTGAFGAPPFEIIERLKQIGRSMHGPVFDVFFDQTAAFGGSYGQRSLVLTSSDTPPALIDLQAHLYDAIKLAKLPGDEPSNPHMTLLYDKRPAPQIGIPRVSFAVREFVLIRSIRGTSHHDHLAHWPLDAR